MSAVFLPKIIRQILRLKAPVAVVAVKSAVEDSRSALDTILREGAQRMLQAAIEAEVVEYIEASKHLLDKVGRRLVVRNGHLPEREILTGAGPLAVKKPRVNDRREGHRFTSQSSATVPTAEPHDRRAHSCAVPEGHLDG